MIDGLIVEATGSSPLARGLQTQPGRPHPRARIIPARAGFTPLSAVSAPSATDHPRSRGVYSAYASSVHSSSGSSPLARGLLTTRLTHCVRVRIIPARAGFTYIGRYVGLKGADHPRSRGVYVRVIVEQPRRRGSSPLARGLRVAQGIVSITARIIPARAGFTPATGRTAGHARDHPRSRGVYVVLSILVLTVSGSSPLARGLPGTCRTRRTTRGIIPARAGLRQPVEGLELVVRIIPARAGFTPEPENRTSRPPDHPRSRGVYEGWGGGGGCGSGSSPLARGLRCRGTRRCGRGRIIPARAGFTPSGPWSVALCRDHPRSRGVYPVRALVCRSV